MVISDYVWLLPKVDWQISYDADGNYIGDYFEPEDYNRIKNNINYLHDYAIQLFHGNPEMHDLGEDVYYGSDNELKASWWKLLQENLRRINDFSVKINIGKEAVYYGNTGGRLLEELIRIEKSTLEIYNLLRGIDQNKVKLAFRFGNMKGVRC